MKSNLEHKTDDFLYGAAFAGPIFWILPLMSGGLLVIYGMWPLAIPLVLAGIYVIYAWKSLLDEIERRS